MLARENQPGGMPANPANLAESDRSLNRRDPDCPWLRADPQDSGHQVHPAAARACKPWSC
jgi:hypothetical protein